MENTNQNQQFEIRRGMVFFIDLTKMTGIPKSEFTPTKKTDLMLFCQMTSVMKIQDLFM